MNKPLIISLLLFQATALVGCGGNTMMPNGMMPNGMYTDPSMNGGAGYNSIPQDPYANSPAYTDPNANFANQPTYADPNAGYPTTPNYTDPNAGYSNNPGTIDPNTGLPLNNPAAPIGIDPSQDPGFTAQLLPKIQAAGGYKALKADDVVCEAIKTMGMTMEKAFSNSPLEHRGLIVKTLLDGWATTEDLQYARQIWDLSLPQDQDKMMSQDAELTKLVTKKLASNSSTEGGIVSKIGGIFTSIGKMVGLSK